MKDFFKRYSYESVRLFLNQVAIGLFGLVLALAAGRAESTALKIGTSVFAIVFYLFLQFSSAWRVGAEDRVSIDLGKRKIDLWVPVRIWILASSLNFLLALMIAFGLWFSDIAFFSSLGAVATAIKYIIEGMYAGVLSLSVGGVQLNTLWFMHFLTSLPALPIVFVSYLCGVKNINFGGLFSSNASVKK